jgi:hypothetical protein
MSRTRDEQSGIDFAMPKIPPSLIGTAAPALAVVYP